MPNKSADHKDSPTAPFDVAQVPSVESVESQSVSYELTSPNTGNEAVEKVPQRYRTYFVKPGFYATFLGQTVGWWVMNTIFMWQAYEWTQSPAFLGLISSIFALPFVFLMPSVAATLQTKSSAALIYKARGLFGLGLAGTLLAQYTITLGAISVHWVWISCLLFLLSQLLYGVATTKEQPARMHFLNELSHQYLVPLERLVGLHSMTLNAGRLIGPSVAVLFISEHYEVWGYALVAVLWLPYCVWAYLANKKSLALEQVKAGYFASELTKKTTRSFTWIPYFLRQAYWATFWRQVAWAQWSREQKQAIYFVVAMSFLLSPYLSQIPAFVSESAPRMQLAMTKWGFTQKSLYVWMLTVGSVGAFCSSLVKMLGFHFGKNHLWGWSMIGAVLLGVITFTSSITVLFLCLFLISFCLMRQQLINQIYFVRLEPVGAASKGVGATVFSFAAFGLPVAGALSLGVLAQTFSVSGAMQSSVGVFMLLIGVLVIKFGRASVEDFKETVEQLAEQETQQRNQDD